MIIVLAIALLGTAAIFGARYYAAQQELARQQAAQQAAAAQEQRDREAEQQREKQAEQDRQRAEDASKRAAAEEAHKDAERKAAQAKKERAATVAQAKAKEAAEAEAQRQREAADAQAKATEAAAADARRQREAEVTAAEAKREAAMASETLMSWPRELDREIASARGSGEPGTETYRQGLDAMKAGNYQLAVTNFAKVMRSDRNSTLSESAEYFGANALYETGDFDRAILQFNDLEMHFPKGRYDGAALLREAQAFLKLNDRIDARLLLKKLLADHAGTPEATAANTMLRDLSD